MEIILKRGQREFHAMPMELAREMAKHSQSLAEWLIQQAKALESGESHFYQHDTDVSSDLAADLRHRANNIEALLIGFEHIAARDELKAKLPTETATPSAHIKAA